MTEILELPENSERSLTVVAWSEFLGPSTDFGAEFDRGFYADVVLDPFEFLRPADQPRIDSLTFTFRVGSTAAYDLADLFGIDYGDSDEPIVPGISEALKAKRLASVFAAYPDGSLDLTAILMVEEQNRRFFRFGRGEFSAPEVFARYFLPEKVVGITPEELKTDGLWGELISSYQEPAYRDDRLVPEEELEAGRWSNDLLALMRERRVLGGVEASEVPLDYSWRRVCSWLTGRTRRQLDVSNIVGDDGWRE